MPIYTVYTINGDDGSEGEYLIDGDGIDGAAAEAVIEAGPTVMVTAVVQTNTTISHQSYNPDITGRPRDDLFSVRSAARRAAQAQSALHIAVAVAVSEGASLRKVAEAANLSIERVAQISRQ
jgi:hypothetical protein